MYAYLEGKDGHLCFKWVRKRREAEEWLIEETILYNAVYPETPTTHIYTDREFKIVKEQLERREYPYRDLANTFYLKRYSQKIKDRIEEVRRL